jgi:hypothetical protein
MALLWAGARTFPSQGPIQASEGIGIYLDRLAFMTMDSFFWPFHSLGYEFVKIFGRLLWFVVAAFWSAIFYFFYLTTWLLIKRKPNQCIQPNAFSAG